MPGVHSGDNDSNFDNDNSPQWTPGNDNDFELTYDLT
jgi:hypothetical protein